MAAAIVPLAASLLPVIVPEVKNIISLIHTAFHRTASPVVQGTSVAPATGPAKMDTAITLVQGLLQSLQGSGVVIPNRDSIQGFIEGLFQTMKQNGELPKPIIAVPSIADRPIPDPGSNVVIDPRPAPFKGAILNLEPTPIDPSNKPVISIKADGRSILVTP